MDDEIRHKQVVFEHDGRRFVYDETLLNAEQAEGAFEVGSYRDNVVNNMPDTLSKYCKAGMVDWKFKCVMYLIVEEIDKKIPEFCGDEDKNEKFLKAMPREKCVPLMNEVIDHFFVSCGYGERGRRILMHDTKPSATEMLLPVLIEILMLATQRINSTLTNNSNSNDSTMTEFFQNE